MTEQAVARTVGFVPPPGVAGARFSPSSMLKVESAATIAERERERERLAKELAQPEAAPPLISKLRTKLDAAIRDRSESGVENMLKEAQLAMNSSYSAEHLKKIQERGYSDIYIQLTETKYNHFLAWLGDFSSNTEGFGFDIAPTPIADLGSKVEGEAKKRAWLDALEDFQDGNPWPDAQSMEAHMKGLVESMSAEAEIQLAEQATKATEAMKKEIDDILAECSFAEIEESFREHIGGFGLGILKGPVIRWRERIDWGENPANPEIRRSAAITVETPSPLDVFPVAGQRASRMDCSNASGSRRRRCWAFATRTDTTANAALMDCSKRIREDTSKTTSIPIWFATSRSWRRNGRPTRANGTNAGYTGAGCLAAIWPTMALKA